MRVEIIVTAGPARGRRFNFEKPDCFLFGRVEDAHISLPDDPYVSRQHFLLELSPPVCKLTDLGSKNGTVVNGVRYGGRTPPEPGMQQASGGKKEVFLNDGDTISVGDACLKIFVKETAQTAARKPPSNTAGPQVFCIRCKRNVSAEAADRWQASGAEYICKRCREKGTFTPQDIISDILWKTPAEEPASGPLSIEGYHIHSMIAQGGMGGIYKATDTRTGRIVAIKTMLPQVAADPENVQTFQREIHVTSQLRHPHIVRLLKHGNVRGAFYCVLEFVDGVDLGQLIEEQGHLTLNDAAPLMLKTLAGLAYAHQAPITANTGGGQTKKFRGVVHRDLKPQNILLTRKDGVWFPKISDFGISKSFESAGLTNLTVAGDVLGTPMYWPREQITHYKYLNPATDVFSIAAVFYEALTGKWVREGFEELLDRCKRHQFSPTIPDYMGVITRNPVIPIRQRNPSIPEAVAGVIERALKEAAIPHNEAAMRRMLATLRYPDAGAFRDALLGAFGITQFGVPEEKNPPIQIRSQAMKPVAEPEPVMLPESRKDSWESIFEDLSAREPLAANDGTYPIGRPAASDKDVALLVLDVVQSTRLVRELGDTQFSRFMSSMYRIARKHQSVSELIFMKNTGDGFLAALNTVPAAFALAVRFLETHNYEKAHIRLALHWGTVKFGPTGEVLGREVRLVSGVEGVKSTDRVDEEKDTTPLPRFDRLLMTTKALTQCDAAIQATCKPAGKFFIESLGTCADLWVYPYSPRDTSRG